MSGLQMLRHIQVHQDTTCGGDTCRHLLQPQTFER